MLQRTLRVSDGEQPPLTSDLALAQAAAPRSLHPDGWATCSSRAPCAPCQTSGRLPLLQGVASLRAAKMADAPPLCSACHASQTRPAVSAQAAG